MAVAAAGAARLEGHRITLETCPHYLALTYDDPHLLACGAGVGKVAPALRNKSHQDQLWDGLNRGYIHTIGSDHVPIKKLGATLWDERPGFPGLATSLPVVLTEGVAKGRIDITRAAQVMAYNPAQLFGLHPQKGEIAVGCDADLVIVDMETAKPVCEENTPVALHQPVRGSRADRLAGHYRPPWRDRVRQGGSARQARLGAHSRTAARRDDGAALSGRAGMRR